MSRLTHSLYRLRGKEGPSPSTQWDRAFTKLRRARPDSHLMKEAQIAKGRVEDTVGPVPRGASYGSSQQAARDAFEMRMWKSFAATGEPLSKQHIAAFRKVAEMGRVDTAVWQELAQRPGPLKAALVRAEARLHLQYGTELPDRWG